jgi:hypothetical protein
MQGTEFTYMPSLLIVGQRTYFIGCKITNPKIFTPYSEAVSQRKERTRISPTQEANHARITDACYI